MPVKVVDASVLGALVFGEPRAAESEYLLGDADLYAPTLINYELASIARKKVLLYPAQQVPLLQALELALTMNITLVDLDQLLVVRLALETGLTTYDASYLYLARRLDLQLVTFDQQLLSLG